MIILLTNFQIRCNYTRDRVFFKEDIIKRKMKWIAKLKVGHILTEMTDDDILEYL
ncbi:hypothetical protein MTP04_17050 [Lysinibacillus sp. PLM2]|nr:hypothetical protein MTP04_17050 [Lysinibacillus sp. PLM2]